MEPTALAIAGVAALAIILIAVGIASSGGGWLAGAAQLTAIALGRYAPYPSAAERPPRGPIRNTIRAAVLTVRHRRHRRTSADEAAEA